MPKPLPDYLPAEVRDFLTPKDGQPVIALNELALDKKLSNNRFYAFFGGSHLRIRPYKRLADWLGLTMDDLRNEVEIGKIKQHILNELASREECKGWEVRDLARHLQTSDQWIYNRYSEAHSYTLDNYKEIAEVFGWTIEKLVSVCLQ